VPFFHEALMQLRIHDVEVITRHVEIPERCPGCTAQIGAAIELNLRDGAMYGMLLPEPDEPVDAALLEFTPEPSAPCPDAGTYFVTGYRCRACNHTLAQGNFRESEDW